MVTGYEPLACANKDPRFSINTRTHEVRQVRCTRNECGHCLPINARRRALAITYMAPERMIRFSLAADAGAPNPLQQARIRIKRVRQALVRKGVDPGDWTWTLELNPAGTGYHAHALQRGGYISQAALQVACHKAGAGFPYINAIRANANRTARYGLKGFGAAGYGLKTFKGCHAPMAALRINQGRLERHTPGFFAVGGVATAVREIERLAVAQLYGSDPDECVVVAWHEARQYLAARGLLRTVRAV